MQRFSQFQCQQFWTIRIYYFLFLGGFSFISPFLNLFYQRRGLSGIQIGLLGTVSAVIGLLVAPLWGHWSDRLVHPRRLLQFAFLGASVAYLLLSQQSSFPRMAIIIGVAAFLLAGVEPVSDTMALKAGIGESGNTRKSGFGNIRLWGSLGWAMFVFIAGWLIETLGIQAAFWGFATMLLLAVATLSFLRPTQESEIPKKPEKGILSVKQIIRLLVLDKAFSGLGFSLAIVWMARAGLYQFQAIYMDELGAGESIIGLVNTFSAVIEIPAMLWADRIVHRLGSHRVLQIAFMIYALSAGLVLMVPQIPTFFVIGALTGLGFSFYNVALVIFLNERSPSGQIATVMALFTSTLHGVVQIVAAPLNGLAFDEFGAYWLYAIALTGSLLGIVVFQHFVTGARSSSTLRDDL
jgi:PPP family 3-phenylpropionic acid transporter